MVTNTSPIHPSLSTKEGSQLLWARCWDARVPPPLNSLKGKVVPRLFMHNSRRRKISVEVHRVYPPGQFSEDEKAFYDQCVIRILVPTHHGAKTSKRHQKARGENEEDEEDEEEEDLSTVVPPDFLDDGADNLAVAQYHQDWRAKYRFPIKALSIQETHKQSVTVYIALGSTRQHRYLIFDSKDDAREFAQVIQAQLDREPERAVQQLEVLAKGVPLTDDTVTLLIEICSASGLLAGDAYTSDPYVKVLFDGKEIHRTDYVSRSLEPIWTIKTNSLFLWTVNVKDLFLSEGLLCIVHDFDQVGYHDTLGQIYITPQMLYQALGERIELQLKPPLFNHAVDFAGYLAIRCRRASEYDKDFMKELLERRKKEKREEASPELAKLQNIAKMATESAGGSSNIASMLTKRTKIVKNEQYPQGLKMYKIRPYPDPKRPLDTTWMSRDQIVHESLRDSFEWIDSGSGQLGTLYVEVIACDDMPNMDPGGFIGNKTDSFVSLVFEDSFVKTDVIDDCLAPRWLPWMKRSFMFRIRHSSSQLHLGVFDYDVSLNPADDHDFIGRVSVDISNLRKETVYTMKYNLYTSSRMSQRKKRGTITVRLRLEIDDDRQFLLSSLEPPPRVHVNTKSKTDFMVVRCTCNGKVDMDRYSMQTINSYIEEILSLQQLLMYLKDAGTSVLLWRGTSHVQIKGKTVKLPIHSMTAFVLSVLLVERPQFFPSFFLFSLAWLLLATMEYRRQLPDVWSRCKSYRELAECLFFGESQSGPDSIEAYANDDAARAFLEEWKQRIADAEDAAVHMYEESMIDQDVEPEMSKEPDSKSLLPAKHTSGISLDPFRPILYPIQQNLAIVCKAIRHVKFIVFWEECYITFWIVSACLLLGALFLFVPWFFIIQWSARIVCWTLFGPWMKLVDVFLVRRETTMSIDGEAIKKDWELRRRRETTITKRIAKEHDEKMKAMKEYMFGKYVTRIPVLKEDRYRDLPMPESEAVPYRPSPLPLSEIAMQEAGYNRKRLPGQFLHGDMIPRIGSHGFTEAPTGRATARPRLVDRQGPGGKLKLERDSTLKAYAQIGSLVISAAVVTWLGVPVLSYVSELMLKK